MHSEELELLSVSILSKLLISPPICNFISLILTKSKEEQNRANKPTSGYSFPKADIFINIIIFQEMAYKPVSI